MISRRGIAIAIILAVLIIPSVLILSGVLRKRAVTATPVALTWWTVEDSQDRLQDLIAAYRATHPQVSITVEQKPAATYFQDVRNAWAQDRGPDIVSIPNTDLASWKDFLQAMPRETKVPTIETRRILIREEQTVSLVTTNMLTPRQVRSTFVDTVGRDVVLSSQQTGEKVYGLPLSMDTLLLFVNRDLLNSAGITEPARTWGEFASHIPKLTIIDTQGNIARAGAGLGLASNVPYAFDLLSLLMMQNGSLMVDSTNERIQFAEARADGEQPAVGALQFYTDFALTNPVKEVQTWNKSFPNALDLFAQGRLAYAFGYYRDRVRLQSEAPTLNFDMAPIPHILENQLDNDATAPPGDQARKITFGSYSVQAVALQAGAKANEAWNFLQFAATDDSNKTYLGRTKQIPAVQRFLSNYVNTPEYSVAAEQALSARSWYRGAQADRARTIFHTMIDDVALNGADPARALTNAAQQIQELYTP